MRRLLLIGCLAACHHASPAASPGNEVPPTCGVPADWDPVEAANGGYGDENWEDAPQPVPAEVRVLAWEQTTYNDVHYDGALLWIHQTDGKYSLMYTSRNPASKTNTSWGLPYATDSPETWNEQDYPAPPTHADLEAFFEHTQWVWDHADDPDAIRIGSGVCDADWQASFGEPAWHTFN